MKTRIISGTVIGAVLVAVLFLGFYHTITYSVVAALLGAVCVFELFHNTGFVKNTPLIILGAIFAMVSPFINEKALNFDYFYAVAIFAVVAVIISLMFHKQVYPTTMTYAIAIPIVISCCLRSIVLLTIESINGLFHLLLLICYTVFADIGAYFIGVFFGKHKMAPVNSPKKTYEGLIGGMVTSIIGVLAVCLIFKTAFKMWTMKVLLTVLTTPIFVLLGVVGDLSASYIKRYAAIKDYGDTIPGHGGIMDRIDSMLLVAPIFYVFNEIFVLSGIN